MGGHTLNLHQFARDGVTLLGHLQGVEGGKLVFAPDLWDNLASADAQEATFVKSVDDYIAKTGMVAPEEILPTQRERLSHTAHRGARSPSKRDQQRDMGDKLCLRLLARKAASPRWGRFSGSDGWDHRLPRSLLCGPSLAPDGKVRPSLRCR